MISSIGIYSQRNSGTIIKDALHFDSLYDDRVDLPMSFVTGTRTISTWIKPDVTTFNGQARQFFWSQYGASGQRTTYAEFRETGVVRILVPTTASGNAGNLIESNAGQYFNAGQWYYISVTIDATLGAVMYIDGVAQTNTDPTALLGFTRSGATFKWGGWNASFLSSNATCKGLAVWTEARTPAEIVADMTRVYTGSETGLKSYFPTDEGSGTTIQDINSVYTGTLFSTNGSPTYEDDFMWVES